MPLTSFESVYEEHFTFVWRCLRALGVAPHAIDDAAQDVFVVVHRQLAGFAGQSALRTWLFAIVRNVASNHRRSVARRGVLEPLSESETAPDADPNEVAQAQQAAAFVRAFVGSVDARKRELFVLCVLEELSVPEAAEALGVPLNTAYTRLRRVRADFRRALLAQREHNERP